MASMTLDQIKQALVDEQQRVALFSQPNAALLVARAVADPDSTPEVTH